MSYGNIEVDFKSKKNLEMDIWSGIDTATLVSDSKTPLITINEDTTFAEKISSQSTSGLSYENTPDMDSLNRRVSDLNGLILDGLKSPTKDGSFLTANFKKK
jgi:hypothetical protein